MRALATGEMCPLNFSARSSSAFQNSRRRRPDMFSPTGSRDPVFECASPSNPLQTRRSAAAEAHRLPQEEHTWTAGDWVVGRNAKAEFDLTNDDLASIDVRRVGGGRLDIRRPKKYYSRPDLHKLSEQKHGAALRGRQPPEGVGQFGLQL